MTYYRCVLRGELGLARVAVGRRVLFIAEVQLDVLVLHPLAIGLALRLGRLWRRRIATTILPKQQQQQKHHHINAMCRFETFETYSHCYLRLHGLFELSHGFDARCRLAWR